MLFKGIIAAYYEKRTKPIKTKYNLVFFVVYFTTLSH
jgi:hypothetical protein